jgi:hypothetical protein
MNHRSTTWGLLAAALAALAAAGTGAPASAVAAQQTAQVESFDYTGAVQYLAVPPGVTQLTITADGGAGGNGTGFAGSSGGAGGLGARVVNTLDVSGLNTLAIYVGGAGQAGSLFGALGGSAAGGGANGASGGIGAHSDFSTAGDAGGGGAASEVFAVGSASPLVVAAGGGGGAGGGSFGYSGGGGGAGGNPAADGGSGFGPGAGGAGHGGQSPTVYGTNGGDGAGFSEAGGGGGGGGGYAPAGGGGGTGGGGGAAGGGGGGGGGGGLSFADGARSQGIQFATAPTRGDGHVAISWQTRSPVNSQLTSSANPIVSGKGLTLTDTIQPQTADGPAPTGTVTFYRFNPDATSTAIGHARLSTSAPWVARLVTSTLPVGSIGLYAVYSGDAAYFPSTAPTLTEQVLPPKPKIEAISPASGPTAGGTTVTITGQHLGGVTGIRFGRNAATRFSCASTTTCTAVSPAGRRTVQVRVTTPSGTSPTGTASAFSYVP